MDDLNVSELNKEEPTETANCLRDLTELQLAHIGGGCGETIAY